MLSPGSDRPSYPYPSSKDSVWSPTGVISSVISVGIKPTPVKAIFQLPYYEFLTHTEGFPLTWLSALSRQDVSPKEKIRTNPSAPVYKFPVNIGFFPSVVGPLLEKGPDRRIITNKSIRLHLPHLRDPAEGSTVLTLQTRKTA